MTQGSRPMNLSKQTRRWTDAKLEREFALRDDNGGSPEGIAWVAAIEAEVERRKQAAS